MNIGILGAGNVGGTLGRRFAALSHPVIYGLRDMSSAGTLLDAHPGQASACAPSELASRCDLIVLAVPFAAIEDAVRSLGDVRGKILVDATNPLKPDLSGLAVTGEDSAGERVARLAAGARVVKAFNTIGAGIMANPVLDGRRALLTVAGDDADAKKAVLDLGASLGFEAVDFGPLAQARLTEALAMTWIRLAYAIGWGPDFAFSVARR